MAHDADYSEHTDETPSVMAGVGATPLAGPVLRTAAEEAVRRGLPLDLVTILGTPDVPGDADRWTLPRPGGHLPAARHDRESARWVARRRLVAAAEEAVAGWPELTVRTWCVAEDDLEGPAASVVRLPPAQVLVVGALGRNGYPPFGLRSASRVLAKRLGCQVLVVPTSIAPCPRAPVVVGIRDRRDAGVLRSAVTESTLRHAPLVVVLVLGAPADPGPHGVLDDVPLPPGTRVIAVADEHVASALVRVAETEHAQVLVIGTEGSASLAGLARESSSRAVIRLSTRPVLLVPAHVEHRDRVAPG